MRIACFDVADWDVDHLRAAWRDDAGVHVTFAEGPLHADVASATEAEVACVFIHSRVDEAVLDRLPRLRLVTTRSTQVGHIDVATCERRGIAVANVPSYCESTVAEHTFALILALSRRLLPAERRGRRGDFDLHGMRGLELKGKTLGVVGTGKIGVRVVRLGRAFGMEVLACDVRPDELMAEVLDFRYVPLELILERSDVVTLHALEDHTTHHMIDARALARMKQGALLINTARGSLVETAALVAALDEGRLGGAALDVLEGEHQVVEEHALLGRRSGEGMRAAFGRRALENRDNVVLTPHNAFNSTEAVARVTRTTVDNIRAWREGIPRNLVTCEVPG